MLKLIGSVMVFGSCAALGLSARQNLRRRVAAADAMLLALGLIRSEIAALADGVPQLAVGRCTDVMEGCSKWQAAVMLLKTMSPALLALDEITAPEDAKAVSLCTHCGTAVIACAHAAGLDDLRQRPIYRELLALGAFHQAVIIEKQDGQRVYRMERWEETKC